MLQVKNYQLLKISNTRNFKRIYNEIKKIEVVHSVSVENAKLVMHVEYDYPTELTEENLVIYEE